MLICKRVMLCVLGLGGKTGTLGLESYSLPYSVMDLQMSCNTRNEMT